MERLILIGGGGHCISCIDVVESTGKFEIAGILDATLSKEKNIAGYPIIGDDRMIAELAAQGNKFLITVGQIKNADIRKKIYDAIAPYKNQLATVIASSALVSKRSTISAGTIVMHKAIVNAEVVIGENNIINTGAIVEHNSVTGLHCHISTGCVINGNCSLGNEVFVGSGSVISNGVTLADRIVIGSGTTVHHSITEPGTYVGSPFRRIK